MVAIHGQRNVDTLFGKVTDVAFHGTYADTDILQRCYVYDDHTVALAADVTNNILAGLILGQAKGISGGVRVIWLPL